MALRSTSFLDSTTYGFEWLRLLLEASLQEGVLNLGNAGTDFMVTANGTGLRGDVAAGGALVKGDTGTPGTGLSQGLYLQVNDAAMTAAVTLAAAHATNPRVDQIVLTINDSSDLGSAGNIPTLSAVTGTATAGATLDNRTGAAALPSNALRLADVLVPAAATTLLNTSIRDRRPFARGALKNVPGRTSGNYSTTSTTLIALDATNVYPRIECSGVPVRLTLTGAGDHNTLNGFGRFAPWLDGAVVASYGTVGTETGEASRSSGRLPIGTIVFTWTPTAGSHRIGLAWATGIVGTIQLYANASTTFSMSVEELVRQNIGNNETTSG